MNKKLIFKILKIIVSIGLLGYILLKIDINETLEIFKVINPLLILISLAILILGVFVGTYRWKLILSKMGSHINYIKLVKLNYIAIFFGAVLPSRLGGDVIKGYYTTKHNKSLIKSSISVIGDRLGGLISFIILNILSIILGYKILPSWIILSIIIIDIALIGFVVIAINEKMFFKLKWFQRFMKKIAIDKKIEKTYLEIMKIKNDKSLLVKIIILSFIINILMIFLNYSYALIFNFKIPFVVFLTFIPIIMTITILPISLNGIGLREYLVIIMFQTIGLTIEQAFALGILNRFLSIIHSLIGGLVYTTENLKNE